MSATEPKPGYRSTEFWLSAIAAVVGLIISSGALEAGSTAAQIVGVVASALVAMGYTAARGRVKADAEKAKGAAEAAKAEARRPRK
jgi:hypothetical protein